MSQHVTYRLPDPVVEDLRYLSFLTQTTPARVIATCISVIAQAVELLRNGGTMLTLAEQQAVQQLHQMIGHWGQAGSPPPDRKTP